MYMKCDHGRKSGVNIWPGGGWLTGCSLYNNPLLLWKVNKILTNLYKCSVKTIPVSKLHNISAVRPPPHARKHTIAAAASPTHQHRTSQSTKFESLGISPCYPFFPQVVGPRIGTLYFKVYTSLQLKDRVLLAPAWISFCLGVDPLCKLYCKVDGNYLYNSKAAIIYSNKLKLYISLDSFMTILSQCYFVFKMSDISIMYNTG